MKIKGVRVFKQHIMKGVESYMHRFAKQTVASWLRKRSKVGANYKGLQPILQDLPLYAYDKTNGASWMCGVYEEFPVTEHMSRQIGLTKCGECGGGGGDNSRTCEHSSEHGWRCWTTANDKRTCQRHGIPTLKELSDWNMQPCWIFDIGVVDKDGKLCFIVEVCHKNPMNQAKIGWLKDKQIPWIELSAEWVMNRVKAPFDLTEGILRSSYHQ